MVRWVTATYNNHSKSHSSTKSKNAFLPEP